MLETGVCSYFVNPVIGCLLLLFAALFFKTAAAKKRKNCCVLWFESILGVKQPPSMAASKVMQLALWLLLCSFAGAEEFIEIQGVSTAPGTPVGDELTGSVDTCKNACLEELDCDCVLVDPLHNTCKLQSDCLYFHPQFEEGGPLELYIKLPERLRGFSVFPGTTANSGSQEIGGKEADSWGTEAECTDRCAKDPQCQCLVIESAERWSASKNHCWMRSNCIPENFQRDQSTASFMTMVKDVPGELWGL